MKNEWKYRKVFSLELKNFKAQEFVSFRAQEKFNLIELSPLFKMDILRN